MSDIGPNVENRLTRLLDRLVTAADAALVAGDIEQARATAEEVRAVDPDNERAAQVLERISARLAPTGERALMTLLFSDLVGSTMLSERVQPEQLRDLFSFYRAAANAAVQRYSGTVMHYSGDGILAGFGYPRPHEDDARRAVLAGLDLVAAIGDARADLERRLGGASIGVRVGIHTGRVVITDLRDDSSVRERDSIVGVAPNLAARIQQEAEPDTVVISDVTQQLVDADFFMHTAGERRLKGISRPVEVFVVERPRYAAARFEADRYRKAGLVGREQSYEKLLSGWNRVREGEGGQAFLVAGEAGIGKTRLVAELLDRVEADGGWVVSAGSLPYYSNLSLWPVARSIERMVAGIDANETGVRPLVRHLETLGVEPRRFVPFFAPLLGIESPEYPNPELEPSALLDETLNRFVEWVAALGARKPILAIFEDLHWADPSTLTFVGRLAAQCPTSVLVVATTRDKGAVVWLADVDVLELGRLDADASSRLVTTLASSGDLDDTTRASIVERSTGVPLFLEELTRSYLDNDASDPIPLRLQELLTWRLKAPDIDLRVVQAAATMGLSFDSGALAGIVGDERLVEDQLHVLVEEGILEPSPTEAAYRFRHALMRDAAYETQVLDVRAGVHAKVAEALAGLGAEPAVVAEHLDRAGLVEQAVGMYLVAAQAEQARGAHPEATRLLSRALDLSDSAPESENRRLQELTARMLRGLSVSSTHGYAAPAVQSDHRRAETLAAELGNNPVVLPSLIAIWAYWLTSGDLATAEGLIERLQGLVRNPEFSWFGPEVESCSGWLAFYEGRHRSAHAHLVAAMQGFEARPPEETVSPFWPLPNDPVAVSAIALACVAAVRGQWDEMERWQDEAIGRSEAIGFPRGPFSLAFVKTYAAWIRRFLGDHETAQAIGADVVGIGQTHGYAYWMLLGSSYTTTSKPGGQPDPEFLQANITNLRLMGQEAFVASNLAYLARLHADRGELEQARSLIDDGLEVVAKTGELLHLPELLRLRAGYSLALGDDPYQALADLKEALTVAEEQDARVDRLRAAADIARLSDSLRPPEWRSWLQAALDAMPVPSAETDTAEQLL